MSSDTILFKLDLERFLEYYDESVHPFNITIDYVCKPLIIVTVHGLRGSGFIGSEI
jgi:hypothetical protein